jgi:glycosyltransferase involved in cell wall biosynthesis
VARTGDEPHLNPYTFYMSTIVATPPSPHNQPQGACVVMVLLPVYNGARFLAQQIESVLKQTGVQVFLMCRDDGSTDASADLLRAHQQRWPDHIHVIEDALGNLGASGNFSRLMHAAMAFEVPAPWTDQPCYVALSDQDDLWHSDKLATAVAEIRRLEQAHPGQPALVHSDLRVIAEDGREIAPSMARYQGLQTQRSGFAAQLLSNTLTGCTSLMNRALLEKRACQCRPRPSCTTGGCRSSPARWAAAPTWTSR